MSVRKSASGALAASIFAGSIGCAAVLPSQREEMAKPEMDPATQGQEDVFHSHIESAREGGFGGHGAQGGGCGCG